MKLSKGNMKNENSQKLTSGSSQKAMLFDNNHFSVPKTDIASVFVKSRMKCNEMTRLPTEKQCLDYFTEYKVPDNIFRHCCKVRKVAVFLAQQLQQKNVQIDVEFVSCLAYFHDLCKMIAIQDFGANEFHKEAMVTEEQAKFWKDMQKKYPDHHEGEMAYELFKDIYPELALTLRNVSSPRNLDPSWEELVVHYTDWRVLKEKVVPLAERLDYLKKRYPRADDSWHRYGQLIKAQEQRIFSYLSFTPAALAAEFQENSHQNFLAVQHGQ